MTIEIAPALDNGKVKAMCAWGDTVNLEVCMPAALSYTGNPRWDAKSIDRCIAPIVQALNDAGILTANSCCGHGQTDGEIYLHDGRRLIIKGLLDE